MDFVRREDYGLSPESPSTRIGGTLGTKVHWVGDHYAPRDHSRCAAAVRAIRRAHLDHPTENYSDIAYNLLVCQHGSVFEGRGAYHRTGANGSTALNIAHYAVCALLGKTGLARPTPEMLHGLRDSIEYLREHAGAGSSIACHRDGHATECPGDTLTTWVRAGAPRPGGDDMATADEIAIKVLTKDGVIVNPASPPSTNTHQSVATSFTQLLTLARRTEDAVKELAALEVSDAQIEVIAARMASSPVFVDALAEKIAEKIAGRMAD